MSDDRGRDLRQDLALDRFWDALVSGDRLPAGKELDPALEAIARRVHALDIHPRPDADVRQQTWEELMQSMSSSGAIALPRSRTAPLNGRGRVGMPPAGPRALPAAPPAGRLLPYLATAGLLAAILALIFVWWMNGNNQATPPALSPTAVVPAGPATDWPMVRGNPDRTGATADPGPSGAFVTLWTFTAPGRLNNPVVAGDTAFITSTDGQLYALDRASGAQKWAFDTGSPILDGGNVMAYPAVADGTVYIGAQTGVMYALDAASGAVRWQTQVANGNLDVAPVVADGLVFSGGRAGDLYAFNAATGAQVWQGSVGTKFGRGYPVAEGGTLYVPAAGGTLFAFNAATGEQTWQFVAAGAIRSAPLDGGLLFVPTDEGAVAAVDAATGEERWKAPIAEGVVVASPAVANGMVVAGGLPGGGLVALDAETGKQLWSTATESTDETVAEVVIGGDLVYTYVAGRGGIVAYDLATGQERGFGATGVVSSTPAISGGALYAASVDGIAYAFASAGTAATGMAVQGTPPAPAVAPTTEAATSPTPSATADAALAGSAELVWERSGSFFDPALDPLGRLWVSDASQQITVFDLDGNEVLRVGSPGSGPGQFDFLSCVNGAGVIAFDPAGNAFVTNCDGRVESFAPDGTFRSQFTVMDEGGQPVALTGIAIGQDGRFYVANPPNGLIYIVDQDGRTLGHVGGPGSEAGLVEPVVLTVGADGNLWVATGSSTLALFSPDGQYLRSIGEEPGGLGEANDIAIDADGNIWAADFPYYRVLALTPDGATRFAFGEQGDGDTGFTHLVGIAVRGSSVFVTDDTLGVLRKYTVTLPAAAAADQVRFVWAASGDAAHQLDDPGVMTMDPAGHLWVTSMPGSFFIFDQDGNLLETWGEAGSGPGQFSFTNRQNADIGNILFGPEGGFYVADTFNCRIQQFDATRAFVREWGTCGHDDGQFMLPTGLVFDDAGNLLVSDIARNDVQRFAPDGTFLGKFGERGTGPGQFAAPGLITVAPDGSLWIGEFENPRVQVLREDGTPLFTFGEGRLAGPANVGFDGNGRVFVVDQNRSVVDIFDMAGAFLGEFGAFGTGDGQFQNPVNIIFADGGRTFFILDWRNNRVQRFDVVGDFPAPVATPVT